MKFITIYYLLFALTPVASASFCGGGLVGSGICSVSDDCCSWDGYCGRSNEYHCGIGCRGGPCMEISYRSLGGVMAFPSVHQCPFSYISQKELVAIAGGNNCATKFCSEEYVSELNIALKEYNVCDRVDIAAYLAQVRKETGHFLEGRNTWDNGVGSIHMTPQNFHITVQQITDHNPSIKEALLQQLDRALGGVGKWDSWIPNISLNDDIAVGDVLLQPPYFWRIGLNWLFTGGQVPGCTGDNLLFVASSVYNDANNKGDQKYGKLPSSSRIDSQCNYATLYWPNKQPILYTSYDDTGFRRITRCIFGNCVEWGEFQREAYFDLALKVLGA